MYVFGLGGVGGKGVEWMSLGFTIHVGTGEMLDVCLCLGGGGVGVGRGIGPGSGEVGWCYEYVSCEYGFFV